MINNVISFRLTAFFCCIILFGCVTNKDMDYVNINNESSQIKVSDYNYQLEVGDLLSVQISTITEQKHDFFNKEKTSNSQLMEKNPYLWGYLIREDGMLELPVLGKIKAEGFTLQELSSIIKTLAIQYFEDPVVSINIINFDVQVLGEVNDPGTYSLSHPEPTLFNAIGNAGDFTELANRKKIKIIRKSQEKYNIFYVDISDKKTLNGLKFYLHPGDVIYVKPLNKRFYAFSNLPALISLSISTITLFVLLNSQ